jgi:hypothetical protein
MSLFTILAQTSKAPGSFASNHVDYGTKYVMQALDSIWQQATSLTWEQAVVAIAFGIIPFMYGWRIYKLLTVIGFGLIGLYIGKWFGSQFHAMLIGAVIGTILLTAVALPLMKWAVCVLGAVAGSIIAAGIWHACSLPQQFVWAGALVGLVGGGMLSFIIFKLSVMLFTSFAGSSVIILGLLSLVYRFETYVNDPPTTHLNNLYYNNHWFLPAVLIFFTLLGILIQYKFLRGSKEWEV